MKQPIQKAQAWYRLSRGRLLRGVFNSLRSRVLFALVWCAIMPVLLISFSSHLFISSRVRDAAAEKQRDLISQVGRQLGSLMKSAEIQLKTLAGNPVLTRSEYSDAQRREEMDRIARTGQVFTDLSLYDANGLLIQSTSGGFFEAKDRTNWFRQALNGSAALSPPQRVLSRDGLDISVYFPVGSDTGQAKRVVRGRVKFDPMLQLLDDATPSHGGQIFLIDSNGNYLGHPNRKRILTKVLEWPVREWQAQPQGVCTDADGNRVLWTALRIPIGETRVNDEWNLVLTTPESTVLDSVHKGLFFQFAAGGLGILAALAMGLWLARRIARPLVSAAQAAEKVARHDLEARIDEHVAMAEMKPLAVAFNSMVQEVSSHRSRLEQLVNERTQSLFQSQKAAEEAVAELRTALEATQEGFLLVKPDGTVLAANNRLGNFFGFHSCKMAGTNIEAWRTNVFGCFSDPQAFAEKWDHALEHGDAALEYEWELVRPARRVLASYTAPVITRNGQNLGQLWMFRDLTKQRELQENLEQAQKMEAIGRLAGGVAHDFNNLLTGIIGNLALSEARLASAPAEMASYSPLEDVAQARGAAERAAQLVKGLLGFSRKSHLKLIPCALNEIVRSFFPFIRRTIDLPLEILVEAQPQLWGIQADPTKIEQILMNLCVNARDAMRGVGTITIKTANVVVTESQAQHHQAVPGEFVRLSVSDDGPGIPAEVVDKIFEPFFTTKEQGKGTGLGLATCYGICQQHGGWIEVESEVGKGAVFNVFLPRHESAPQIIPASAGPVPLKPPAAKGHETVLLVDDELVVRRVAEAILKQHGYKILTASDGAEAVEKFEEHRQDIGLILMDMTMPRLNGPDAFRAIRRLDADVPALICSGYLVDLGEFETEKGERPNGFVQKPYDLHEMLTVVRATLDEHKTTALAN